MNIDNDSLIRAVRTPPSSSSSGRAIERESTCHLLLENLSKLLIHGVGHGSLSPVAVGALEAVLDVLQEGKRHPPAKLLISHAQVNQAILTDVVKQKAAGGGGRGRTRGWLREAGN